MLVTLLWSSELKLTIKQGRRVPDGLGVGVRKCPFSKGLEVTIAHSHSPSMIASFGCVDDLQAMPAHNSAI
uniref:U650n n=1 Tax=Mycobacterium leprae TaxID=1769 RepID=Q50106_MYCLR|nr:u650n [Mycobacterium leprae]